MFGLRQRSNPQDASSLRNGKIDADDTIKYDNSDVRLDDIVEKHIDEFTLCNTEIIEDTSW